MKLLLFFLISISLWSADIDSRLYDGNNTVEYYEEITKLIDKEQEQDENKTDADIERIATEHMILGKLKDMLSFTPKIDALPDSLLPADQNVSTKNYLSFFNALTDAYIIMDGKKKDKAIYNQNCSI